MNGRDANMSNNKFVSADAMRSAVVLSAHTTNTPASWHTTKPAFYAAFYAGYEAAGGSAR
jgi:cytosine/adenosine deaminase-related metal-dependent hydrolase